MLFMNNKYRKYALYSNTYGNCLVLRDCSWKNFPLVSLKSLSILENVLMMSFLCIELHHLSTLYIPFLLPPYIRKCPN